MRPFQKLAHEETLGRYRLIARLGAGGMAEVFLARLVGAGGFEKLVAVKRMLSNLSDDRRFVAMFLNEGRVAAQLEHPNVCHVYELDEANGTLFLAMEFLRGLPWSEVVPAIPDRPRTTLVRFITGAIAQACDGLHHAHTVVGVDGLPRPIVHRDVSPSNLFVTNEGIVKLLDFGVSKVLTESNSTVSGMVKGKLPYLSPEQLHNKPVDARSDIFSLATVTWEAFSGRPLFDRGSNYETMIAVEEAEVPALPGDDPVTRRLDAVLRRALARDPAHRHGSAREFADDLRQAIAACGAPMMAIEIQANVSTWLGPSLLRHGRELAALVGGWRQLEDMADEQTRVHEPSPIAGARLRDVSVAVSNAALDAAQTVQGRPEGNAADTITHFTPVSTNTSGVTVAGITPPRITALGVMAPRVTALGVTAPRVTVPSITVSSITVPSITVPDVTVPDVTVPDVTVPGVTVPGVARLTPSGELTPSRLATAVTVEPPGFAMGDPTMEVTQWRAVTPGDVAPISRPEWVPIVLTPKPPPASRQRSLILLVIAMLALEAGVVVGRLLA